MTGSAIFLELGTFGPLDEEGPALADLAAAFRLFLECIIAKVTKLLAFVQVRTSKSQYHLVL